MREAKVSLFVRCRREPGASRDQPDVASRVVASGAGLRLRPGSSQRKIAAAVGRVLNEVAFSAAAGRMAEAIRRDIAEDRAVAELEALVGDHSEAGTKLPLGVKS